MEKMKIYVATHKHFEQCADKNLYEPLVVGAYKNNVNYDTKDNTGDNISVKNADYCELTGQYWIWKNDDSDITGLTHYRRYFYKNRHILTANEVKKILCKNDLIIANKRYLTKSIYDIYKESSLQPYLTELIRIFESEYPEYYPYFDNALKEKYTYPCNMLICKKEVFNQYSEWLFDILFKLEKRINDNTKIKKEPRAYGFLSENMLITYIMKNNLKYTTLPVYNTEVIVINQILLDKVYYIYGKCKN